MKLTRKKGGQSRKILTEIGMSDSFVVPAGCKIDHITTKKTGSETVSLSLGTTEGAIESVSFDVLTVGTPAVKEFGHTACTAACTTDKADFDIAFDSAMTPVVVPMLAWDPATVSFAISSTPTENTGIVDETERFGVKVDANGYQYLALHPLAEVSFDITAGATAAGNLGINLSTALGNINTLIDVGDTTPALVAARVYLNAAVFLDWVLDDPDGGATLHFTRQTVGPSAGAAAVTVNATGITVGAITEPDGVDLSTINLTAQYIVDNLAQAGWTATRSTATVIYTADAIGTVPAVPGIHIGTSGIDTGNIGTTAEAVNQGTVTGVAEAITTAFVDNEDYVVTNELGVVSFEAVTAGAKAGSGTLITTLGASGITFGAISFGDIGPVDYHAGVNAVAPTAGSVLIATVGSPTTTAVLAGGEVATISTVATGLRTDINADASSPWVASGEVANIILTAKGEGNLGAVSITNGTAALITYSAPSVTSGGAGSANVVDVVALSTAGVAPRTVLLPAFSTTADQTVYVNLTDDTANIDLHVSMSRFN